MKLQQLWVVLWLTALAGMPSIVIAADAEYDCHVILDSNAPRIVLAEAPDRMRAEALAARVRIKLGQGRTVGVKQVKQCVLRHSERFADPAMEVQRKNKPL